MSNEIKEILEALKPQDEEFTKAGIKEYPLALSIKEQKTLLDYITNLQEENKLLKDTINKSRNLFYEKCRISRDGIFTFNVVDYYELDKILRGEDDE